MRLTLLKMPRIMGIVALAAIASVSAATDDDVARPLLMQALENQYHGRYHAAVEMMSDSFSEGRDSLAGWIEFADDIGERKICVAGADKAFEYRSLNFGREQWIKDDRTNRIRRIANRQWKKGVFGNLLTYEDMLKLPADFFLEYSSCKGVTATDSSYGISMTLKPLYQSFYSRIDVTLAKSPVLVKAMTFYGTHGEKLKSLEVKGYKKIAGKWLVTDMCVADIDSTASLEMCFSNFSFSETPAAVADRGRNGLSLLSERPAALPVSSEDAEEMEQEGSEAVRN